MSGGAINGGEGDDGDGGACSGRRLTGAAPLRGFLAAFFGACSSSSSSPVVGEVEGVCEGSDGFAGALRSFEVAKFGWIELLLRLLRWNPELYREFRDTNLRFCGILALD